MTRKQIWSVIRKLDYTLDDNTVETMTYKVRGEEACSFQGQSSHP